MPQKGHYYGDEYLLQEFEAQYPWDDVQFVKGHPFRRKWDYYMTQGYDDYANVNMSIPGNTTVAIDAYHDYDFKKYPNGQTLTAEQTRQKRTYEGLFNDARRDLHKSVMTKADLDRFNVEFVYCAVDGVLHTFVVTHKAVKAGEQMFIYYGPGYG